MSPNVALASAFLEAIKNRDLSQTPLAENLTYTSPLSGGMVRGRKQVIAIIGIYLPIIIDVEIVRHIADRDYVATVWKANTTFGPIMLVYVFRMENYEIAEIEAFYDPRSFLERMGNWASA